MKVLITENKLFNSIYDFIDGTFDSNDMSWVYGRDEGEDGYNGADLENENFLIFYKGDWEGEDFSNIVFNYFTVDYYSNEPSSKPHKDKAPILEVMGEYAKRLDTMFGNYWIVPMKKWFEVNFGLPVKTITKYL